MSIAVSFVSHVMQLEIIHATNFHLIECNRRNVFTNVKRFQVYPEYHCTIFVKLHFYVF